MRLDPDDEIGVAGAPPLPAGPRAPTALLDRRPLRAIVDLAAPTTAVMMIATTTNVLHTYFVSRLGDASIAAVSLVFPISLIVITVMSGGLGAGVSSAIARNLGAGHVGRARAAAEHALLLSAGAAVFFTVVLELGAGAIFRVMGGRDEVLRQATLFGRTLFAGLAISFACGTFDSIMRGEGNVRIPALCATLSLVLQIVLTPLLMFVADLGLVGAPLATLGGQLIGSLPRARHIFGGHGMVHPRVFPAGVARRHFAEILRVGIPASLSAGLNYVALIVLTAILAHLGPEYLTAYGLGTRLDFLLFSIGYGLAVAALTLIGMATGARRPDLIERYVTRAGLLAVGVVAVPVLIAVARPHLWLGIFTASPEIHRIGAEYLGAVAPSYLFTVTAMVIASSFQGIGRATVPLAVMIVRVAAVVTAALVLTRALGWGAQSVFVAIAAGNVFSCLTLASLFRVAILRLRRAAPAPPVERPLSTVATR
jgi:MATE family, multidrug efflux pump